MTKLGTLAGVLGGLEEGAGTVGGSYLQDQYIKNLLNQAMQEQEEQDRSLIETIEQVDEKNKKTWLQKPVDWFIKTLGDKYNIQLGNYKQLTDDTLKENILVESYIKKNNLPKNKDTRKAVKEHIKTTSPEELYQEFEISKIPTKEPIPPQAIIEKPKKQTTKDLSFEERHPTLNSFKELLTSNPFKAQTYKNIGATIVNTPSRLLRHALSWLGNIDEAMDKNRKKQGLERVSPSLKEALTGPINEGLKRAEENLELAFGSDPQAKSKEATEMLVDMLTLPVAKVAKVGSRLARAAKNIAKGAAQGAGYAGLYSGGDPEAMKYGAILGGALNTALGAKTPKAEKLKTQLSKIKERAGITSEQEVLKRAELLGKEATIPEIVGDEKLINKLKRDPSKSNIERMEALEENIKKASQKIQEMLPKEENVDLKLYKNLVKTQEIAKEEVGKLFDVVKESGVGKQALLDRSIISDWSKAIREALPEVKGLPRMKGSGGSASPKYLDTIDMLINMSPSDQQAYRQFVIQNIEHIPTASNFLKFRSKIRKRLDGPKGPETEGLSQLSKSLDNIVERADPESTLKKASTEYAIKVAPFEQKGVQAAITSGSFKNAEAGRPSIFKAIATQSNENAHIFNQLSSVDKKRVVAAIIEEVLEKGEKHPARVIQDTWEKLPKYIKETTDPALKKIVDQIKTIAHTNKTLSSLQQATTASIGSRANVDKATKLLRALLYGGSLASGNPTITAGTALLDVGLRGINRARHAAFRKMLGQKNLKYYLNPELLDTIRKNKLKNIDAKVSGALVRENIKKED